MNEPIVYEGLCPSPTCEWPSSPDYHMPWCQHATRRGEHHHTVKRSQGGLDEPQAFLCVPCHRAVHAGKFTAKVEHGMFQLIDNATGEELARVRVSGDWDNDSDMRFWPMRVVSDAGEAHPPEEAGRAGTPPAQAGATTRGRIAHAREVQVPAPASETEHMYVGWTPPADLTFETWAEMGRKLGGVARSIGFLVGDWIAVGEERFGEMAAQVMDELGLDYQTIANYTLVCRSLPAPVRRPELSFSHHAAVASLPLQEAQERLQEAVDNGWSSRELRAAVRASKGAETKECTEHVFVCRKCGAKQE